METFNEKDERLDDLQINGIKIYQNPFHYCFTSDAVRLANYAQCKTGETIIDLCSGSGVIGILLSQKTKASKIILVELQEYLAKMSERSVNYNNLQSKIQVINDDLKNLPNIIANGSIDVVVCNPPYKMQNGNKLSEKTEIALCKHEITTNLEEIIKVTSKILRFGGTFYTINKEERLTDLIMILKKYKLEPKELIVIPSAKGSSLIMVKAKKGGNSGIRIKVMPQ